MLLFAQQPVASLRKDAKKRFIWRHHFHGNCIKVIRGHTDWVHTIQPYGHCGIAT
jgi:hypothetical protein